MVHLSPGIRAVEPYPFEELDRRKAAAIAAGRRVIDFGVGDPREETPAFIRDAFRDAIEPTSSYPRAAGLPELREAILVWVERRFGVLLDADRQILPTLGSKELVFSLAQAVIDPAAGRDTVLVTAPGYTIPERGARFAGGARGPAAADRGERLPPRPRRGGRGHVASHRAPVAELPEQPDRRGGAVVLLRGGRRALPGARRPPRLRRGLQRALVRRRAAARAPCSSGI